MKELKLILLVVWIILFPLVDDITEYYTAKTKRISSREFKKFTKDEEFNYNLFKICFFIFICLLIHFY